MGPVRASTLVERTTRYLIIVALPLGRRADQVCDALTRRIQGLPEGAMRTLTWDQGPEMAPPTNASPQARAWRCFSLTPTAPGREEPTKTPTGSSAATCPKKPPSPALPRRHRLRTGQLPQSHPRLPHPNRSIQPTHCYHPLTPPSNTYRHSSIRSAYCHHLRKNTAHKIRPTRPPTGPSITTHDARIRNLVAIQYENVVPERNSDVSSTTYRSLS